MFSSLFGQFSRVLRYFSAPFIGLLVMYCNDDINPDLGEKILVVYESEPVCKNGPVFESEPVYRLVSWWPFVVAMLCLGAVLYQAHRIVIHSWFNKFVIRCTLKEEWKVLGKRYDIEGAPSWGPDLHWEFELARAYRECTPQEGEQGAAYAMQKRLNERNSASHLLWCGAWAVPAVLGLASILAEPNATESGFLSVFFSLRYFLPFLILLVLVILPRAGGHPDWSYDAPEGWCP